MTLYFRCPQHGEVFATDEYALIENRGVVTTREGQKILQGTVAVNSSCPHCGRLHRYGVDEVMCSIDGGKKHD